MSVLQNHANSSEQISRRMLNFSYKPVEGGASMKALAWFGPKDVRMPDDVILQVTGITICGSDLHLFKCLKSLFRIGYHGEIMTLQKGDILGHESMGKVFKVGPNIKNLKSGQRVVSSFQIACGKCDYCRENLSSFCNRTNNSSRASKLQNYMYGQRDAGFSGYFTSLADSLEARRNMYCPRTDRQCTSCLSPTVSRMEKQSTFPTSFRLAIIPWLIRGVNPGDVVGIWYSDVTKRVYELCPKGMFHEPKKITHKIRNTLMLETDVPETINEIIVSVRKIGRCRIIALYAGCANAVNVGTLMEKGVRELYPAFDNCVDGVELLKQFSSAPSSGCPPTSRVDDWISI
ncbi:chaperonin 10-like protein [Lentinula lateritia]|uniref:Chaperonin 10-like protein n=1 Tax=Lentinula aff. lateritia TaxID=2804960 RepID=A0ACC1TRU8_9AGAR|nr:chaperonin 10-like protein [Lentinula aff. lateritia]KAJ3848016.1 chaperonin 10-like protein [Lentinula lateritia]